MSSAVLVLGLGQIGMGYDLKADAGRVYSHARAFSTHPAFHLAAAVDPDPQRRATFTQVYSRPAYATIDEALQAHSPDLITIATPTDTHAATLTQCLAQARPRAILCEKPLAYELADAQAMVQACAERSVQLYVNYPRRADTGVIEVKRRLDSGAIGAPVKGVAWYSKGFLNNGSHFFNLLEYWLGPACGSTLLNRGRLWDGVDPEPDVEVRFERGSVTFLAAREEQFSHYSIELVAANGRLRYEQRGTRIEWQGAQEDPVFPGYRSLPAQAELIASGMDRFQWHVADQLANAMAGRPAQLCDGNDALATLINMNKVLG